MRTCSNSLKCFNNFAQQCSNTHNETKLRPQAHRMKSNKQAHMHTESTQTSIANTHARLSLGTDFFHPTINPRRILHKESAHTSCHDDPSHQRAASPGLACWQLLAPANVLLETNHGISCSKLQDTCSSWAPIGGPETGIQASCICHI